MKIDCLGGIDERNTLKHCNGMNQLGFVFQCSSTSNQCFNDENLCTNINQCLYPKELCSKNLIDCSRPNDFRCFNGTCIEHGRCNGNLDCHYGEDEYWCHSKSSLDNSKYYRMIKERNQFSIDKQKSIQSSISMEKQNICVKRNLPINISSFTCNRGVSALNNRKNLVCFCPPSYYGNYCEYHSDRLTSYINIDLSQSSYGKTKKTVNLTIKVLTLLIYENEIIYTRQTHLRTWMDFDRIAKKRSHLIYSRDRKFLEIRKQRRRNRTLIFNENSYSLRYEAYELNDKNSIALIGVWIYPIHFDFLPSFRFAKTLHFYEKQHSSACSSNPCSFPHSDCHILQNNRSQYICLCKSGYSGENCSIYDQQCANQFCFPPSLCKPTYLGKTAGSHLPLCVCPLHSYGTRCALKHDQCWKNVCRNNGTCYPSNIEIGKFYCFCQDDYYGEKCELKKGRIDMKIQRNNISGISVIQNYYIDFNTFDLNLEYQDLIQQTSVLFSYKYEETYAPNIILFKSYSSFENQYPTMFVLSFAFQMEGINISTALTEKNRCLNSKEVFPNVSVYQYHQICENNVSFPDLFCFFNDEYLCFCEVNHYRAECFIYNHQLDKCDQCFSNGRCIQGDSKDNFKCLCSKCHYGSRCQYSSERFSFTLEQILTHGLLSTKTYLKHITLCLTIIITCTFFLMGIWNNFFTFTTFHRSKLLRTGVGHYLYTGSIINQISLLFLLLRIIHIVLSTYGMTRTTSNMMNTFLCKFLSYTLSTSSQLAYWLMSTVAIERFYVTWNVKGTWFKKPWVVYRIIFIIAMLILLINAPQLVFYDSIVDTDTIKKIPTCVLIYSDPFWMYLNQVNSYLNSLLPLLINIICTSGIMLIIARQKLLANQMSIAKTKGTLVESNRIDQTVERWNFFRNVIHENIELIFGPAITILPQLFCLPQLILSTRLICHDFDSMIKIISIMKDTTELSAINTSNQKYQSYEPLQPIKDQERSRNDHIRNIVSNLLTVISLIFLIPGLWYPMIHARITALLNTVTVADQTRSILTTISYLFEHKAYIPGTLIAIFSVVVPFAKAILLLLMNISKSARYNYTVYTIVRDWGKWSMADVFVTAVFLSYLSTTVVANIEATLLPGFYCFLVYCIVSLLAVQVMVPPSMLEIERQ
ncbi:hypothetical protein I4U23_023183 [Adineta vaga]|nr:hypothetical protein I4U23_023183 [Adineta vaga]